MVEIVGMTFGGIVYCIDPQGKVKWQKDLRPKLSDSAHAYMTPILCDLDGDKELEILAMTNGSYSNTTHGKIFALSADGTVLDEIDVGPGRYWGEAFVTNTDDDPYLELVVGGLGGYDVVQLAGYGPNVEHFQRRRSYQRLNVMPWAYEDSYFIYRGTRDGVENLTDNLVLDKVEGGEDYLAKGTFTTELLTLPTDGFFFNALTYKFRTPEGTSLAVNILDAAGNVLLGDVASGTSLDLGKAVRLQFILSTTDSSVTPLLDAHCLSFERMRTP